MYIEVLLIIVPLGTMATRKTASASRLASRLWRLRRPIASGRGIGIGSSGVVDRASSALANNNLHRLVGWRNNRPLLVSLGAVSPLARRVV